MGNRKDKEYYVGASVFLPMFFRRKKIPIRCIIIIWSLPNISNDLFEKKKKKDFFESMSQVQ